MDGRKKMKNDGDTERGFHVPVLKEKVVSLLLTDPAGLYVDCTVGGGGHARALLEASKGRCRILGIDRDPEALRSAEKRLAPFRSRVELVRGRLSQIGGILENRGVHRIDGVLYDLGISSHQIDTPGRGFSFMADGPLDMRMDTALDISARTLVNELPEEDLADLLYIYGEERNSRRIARRICAARTEEPIETTGGLAWVTGGAVPPRFRTKTLARVWQALRFRVNNELEELRESLLAVYPCLPSGGRLAAISYESLMDRMVKRFFKGYYPEFSRREEPVPLDIRGFRVLTKKVVRPDEGEIEKNSRARSALLRAAEKK